MTILDVLGVAQTTAVSSNSWTAPFEANLPDVVVSRAGCFVLASRLVTQGKLEAAAAFVWLLQQVTATANYGGYALPWRSIEEMAKACIAKGIPLAAVHFLYQTNLLNYPQAGSPAVVYAQPGYPGILRVVRNGGKVWSRICACSN